jgi:hypothetical protein
MVNASLARTLRWLIIQMKSPVTYFNKNVSYTSKLGVEDDLASKEFFIELDARSDIRRKNVDMMNVTNQPQLSLSVANSVGTSSFFKRPPSYYKNII